MHTPLPLYGPTLGPLGFPMPDRQARVLDTLLKSLPKTKEYDYRKAVVAKAPTEFNPGERSDVSWISTESPDRVKEVVIARDMNDNQFQANPIVTLQHAYWMQPVGKSLWRKRVKDGDLVGIKAKTNYPAMPESWPEADPWISDKVFAMVQTGMMSGKSIGFLPTKVHIPDEKEAKKNGWGDNCSLVIDEWLLLEYACCFLPANQDTLVEAVSKGSLDLNDDLIEALGIDRKRSVPVQICRLCDRVPSAVQPPTPPAPTCRTPKSFHAPVKRPVFHRPDRDFVRTYVEGCVCGVFWTTDLEAGMKSRYPPTGYTPKTGTAPKTPGSSSQ